MSTAATLQFRSEQRTVLDFINLYKTDRLKLSPAFQRRSVWQLRDRKLLIESIFRNYPVPTIFLYRRHHEGNLVFDVVDGKQRLETILYFMGLVRGKSFEVKFEVPGGELTEVVSASSLRNKKRHADELRPLIEGYRLTVIEVEGALAQIVDLFIRINSTGKPLSSQERRNAKYSGSAFLRQSAVLAEKLRSTFDALGVFTEADVARMKPVEFVAELTLSAQRNDVINKKAAVDKVMAAASHGSDEHREARAAAEWAIRQTLRMFPELRTSRFRKPVDFYTLALLVHRWDQEAFVLNDVHRNALAWGVLSAFGREVDAVREAQRRVENVDPAKEIYREYLLTVSQMTDDQSQRRKREKILRSVLDSIFERKDARRLFTPEQRRILWGSSEERTCSACSKPVTWNDLALDHIRPHSKGGRSELDNAALMHVACNAASGNGRKRSPARLRAAA